MSVKNKEIKVIDILVKKTQFPVKYNSQRIRRTPDGEVIEERGRPDTEDILEVHVRQVFHPWYLIEGEGWFREKAAWYEFGKKRVNKAVKEFLESRDSSEVSDFLEGDGDEMG